MLMWRATGPGNAAFILGSIHMGRPDMFPLPAAAEEAFARSEILVVEADVEGPEMDAFRQRMGDIGQYPEGESLSGHIRADTRSLLEKMEISIDEIDRMRPWLAAASIQADRLRKLGFEEDSGLDRHFLRRARGVKEIVEIEGFEGQFRVLDSLTPDEQDRMLYHTLVQLDRFEDFVDPLIAAWRTGDEAAFYDIFCREYLWDRTFEPLLEKMIFKRNEHMLARVESYLRTGRDHFVLVGAGHLTGPKGVIARLKEKRYEVFQE